MWAYTAKIAEICNFWYKFAQRGYTSISDSLKIKHGGGYPKSVPSGQISSLSLLKCGLTTPKIAEIGNFWYKFAQKWYTPLSDFYKMWLGGGSTRFTSSCQISSLWVKKCGSTAPKIAKIDTFWYKFAQKGYTPLRDFTVFCLGEGAPGPHPHATFYHYSFKNVALQPRKLPKMVIFGKNLALGKNSGG